MTSNEPRRNRHRFFTRRKRRRINHLRLIFGRDGSLRRRRMKRARFTGELVEGHRGVRAVIVPFDPEEVWRVKPHRLAGRRHGWLVKGKLNGKAFDGYIGERWGNFFITVTEGEAGDPVAVELQPTG